MVKEKCKNNEGAACHKIINDITREILMRILQLFFATCGERLLIMAPFSSRGNTRFTDVRFLIIPTTETCMNS